MQRSLAFVVGMALGVSTLWSVGCASQGDQPSADWSQQNPPQTQGLPDAAPTQAQPSPSGGVDAGVCTSCITAQDCAGQVCAQFQGDIFCARSCSSKEACAAGTTCTTETAYDGQQVSVCVPDNNACGHAIGPMSDGGPPKPPPPPPGCDAGPANMCGSLVDPSTPAQCHSCSGTSQTCQPNGCYGGWWCDTSINKCHAPPTNCPPTSGNCGTPPPNDAGVVPVDAGPPVMGAVGPNGGTVSRLYFTVVGDTRPPGIDDTQGYPSAIIQQIYGDIAALNPAPPFSVSTGDYMFAQSNGGQSGPQLDLYLAARAHFAGMFFPAMGNHECTGGTSSNCGTNGSNGVTQNYTDFMNKLLGPIQKTLPYYSINVNASDGSWTSKFVFIAANAWDSTQASWLSGVMAQPTTYTFVLRHEPSGTSGGPPGMASDQIISGFPYTLFIVGHSHTYGHKSAKEVLFGNGGAPLTGSGNYGYGVISQRASDNAVTVDMMDYQSNQPDSSFHFAVNPDGSAAPP